MIGSDNCIHVSADKLQKRFDIKAMAHRQIRRQISLRQPKQAYRGIHPSPILGVVWTLILLLQVNKSSRRLNQALKIICVV